MWSILSLPLLPGPGVVVPKILSMSEIDINHLFTDSKVVLSIANTNSFICYIILIVLSTH